MSLELARSTMNSSRAVRHTSVKGARPTFTLVYDKAMRLASDVQSKEVVVQGASANPGMNRVLNDPILHLMTINISQGPLVEDLQAQLWSTRMPV